MIKLSLVVQCYPDPVFYILIYSLQSPALRFCMTHISMGMHTGIGLGAFVFIKSDWSLTIALLRLFGLPVELTCPTPSCNKRWN